MRLENGDEKEEGDRDGVVVGRRERKIQTDRQRNKTDPQTLNVFN